MGNAVRLVKACVAGLQPEMEEGEAKGVVVGEIDRYIEVRGVLSGQFGSVAESRNERVLGCALSRKEGTMVCDQPLLRAS